jgi:hypothetical protein
MWDKIVNPLTNRHVSIYTPLGKKIIKNYMIQIGGYNNRKHNCKTQKGGSWVAKSTMKIPINTLAIYCQYDSIKPNAWKRQRQRARVLVGSKLHMKLDFFLSQLDDYSKTMACPFIHLTDGMDQNISIFYCVLCLATIAYKYSNKSIKIKMGLPGDFSTKIDLKTPTRPIFMVYDGNTVIDQFTGKVSIDSLNVKPNTTGNTGTATSNLITEVNILYSAFQGELEKDIKRGGVKPSIITLMTIIKMIANYLKQELDHTNPSMLYKRYCESAIND